MATSLKKPRLLILFALAAIATTFALASPTGASAKTFCVNTGGRCVSGGVDEGVDFAQALADAKTAQGPDDILLGGDDADGSRHEYAGPFAYDPGIDPTNTLAIRGTGSHRPVVRTNSDGQVALTLHGTTVEHVDVDLAQETTGLGISLAGGGLNDVNIRGGGLDVTGVQAFGQSRIADSTIAVGGERSIFVNGSLTLDHVSTDGAFTGVQIFERGRVDVSRSRLSGSSFALATTGSGGFAQVVQSLLTTTLPFSQGVFASDADLILSHITVAHTESDAAGGSAGLSLFANTRTSTVDLSNVALVGYANEIRRDGSGTQHVNVFATQSVWDNGGDLGGSGDGTFSETGDVHAAPRVVDLLGGDLRPRGGSPAIDADQTSSGLGYFDLNGVAAVDGDGNGSVHPDAGALEYKRQAPVISDLNAPGSGAAGTPLDFAAAVTDADGENVAVSWDFGDGATGSGNQVSHAYAAPGTFTVKVTATDEGGLTATRSATVTIAAPAPAGGSAGAGSTTAADRTAPVVRIRLSRSRIRVTRTRGLALRVDVTEASRARITLRRVVRRDGRARLVRVRGTLVRNLRAGRNRVALRAALRRAHVLKPGTLVFTVTATDAAGNRSQPRTARLTLRK